MTKIKYKNAQTDHFHQNDAEKSFNVIFVKCNANDEKIIFMSQIDNIHQNIEKVSEYAF